MSINSGGTRPRRLCCRATFDGSGSVVPDIVQGADESCVVRTAEAEQVHKGVSEKFTKCT